MAFSHSNLIVALQWLHPPIFLAAAAVFWLWPFFQAGWKGEAHRFLPEAVNFQYNAAGLFTRRVGTWWDHHIEVELRDGTRVELPERAVFPMGAFGYRSRLDRILNESNRSRLALEIRNRTAEYVATRIRMGETNIAAAEVVKILLVRSKWRVGSAEMANPAGHWNPPASQSLSASSRETLGIWAFHQDSLIPVIALPLQMPPGEDAVNPTRYNTPRRRLVVPD